MPLDTLEQHNTGADTFRGGAIIDSKGHEVPITEAMIREACERLEVQWVFPGAPAGSR